MLLKFLLEAHTQKTANRINAISNAAIEALIIKAYKSMLMVKNSNALNANNDMAALFKEMLNVSKKGYDLFFTWWFYCSYCVGKLNKQKKILVKLKSKNESIKVILYVLKSDYSTITAQYYNNEVEVFLPLLPITYTAAKNLFNNKKKIQSIMLVLRTRIVHELRHHFLRGEGMLNYRLGDDEDWNAIHLPLHYAYAMYCFQPNELESRYEEAVKLIRETRKSMTLNLNILTYFANTIYDDFRLKRRAFLNGEFGINMNPIATVLMKWCVLVWLPEWNPKVKQLKQWLKCYELNKDNLPLIIQKTDLLNKIADKTMEKELSELEMKIIDINIEDAFNTEGDEWWNDEDFTKKFMSLGGLKKFLKCIEEGTNPFSQS